MAGTIIADKIQTENSFLTLNVGATQIASMNSSGIYSSSGTKMIGTDGSIGNSSISGATVSGNLNFDSVGTSGIRLPAANTLAFHTAGTEDMRIDSSGNVGIGTISPGNKLTVANNSATSTTFLSNIIARIQSNGSGADASLQFSDNTAYAAGISLNQGNLALSVGGVRCAQVEPTNGNFQFNSGYGSVATVFGCRAWVNFNGTGTVAIRAGGNVSSITDEGAGLYRVNFTTAMPDANYAVSGLMGPTVSNAGSDSFATSLATTSVLLQHYEAGTLRDANPVSCVIHR